MNFYAWTGLINTISSAIAVILVGLHHDRDPRRITFVLFTLCVAQWSFFYFLCFYSLWQATTTQQTALFFYRALMVGSCFIPATFFHHVATLVDATRTQRVRQLIRVGYILAAVFLITNFTPLMIRTLEPRSLFPFWPVPGPFFKFYTAWFFAYVAYAVWLIFQGSLSAVGAARNQLRYFLIGTIIAFAGGSMNFLLWYGISIPPTGNVVVPFYLILTALAVIRYQFMDIKVAITRTGVLLGTYLVVLGAPFAVGWWGKGWLTQRFGEGWWLIPLGLCTVLATIGPFAYAYLRRKAERALLKEQRRYQRALIQAARGMTRVRDLAKLTRLIVRGVVRIVNVQHASLFLWDKDTQRYRLVASDGPKRFSLDSRYVLEAGHPLVQWLKNTRRILNREEPPGILDTMVKQKLMGSLAAIVIPGFVEDELIGFLALGDKLSGAGYLADDLNAFSTLAHEAAIAIENAHSYEELLKVNEHLRLANDRLVRQERLAAAGQFATGMAHEIKNPLSAIKTFAEYLPEKYQDPAFRDKFFKIVQSEIDRINTIVKELLEFAKPAPLQLQPVHLSQLLDETLTLLSNKLLKQGIELHKRFHENGLMIQVDPKQLKQVILNLFLNSLEAMEGGGRIEVETLVRDDYLVLKVTDSGCGIADEHQHKLFDPFFTTKERGMGLGLAVVKGIIDRHGGSIYIRSRSGQGTTVEISLPSHSTAASH